MLRLASNLIGVVAATVLLVGLMTAAFVIASSTPSIHYAWYLGGAMVLYSMIITAWLNR